MDNKPDLQNVLKVLAMKEEASKLYDEIDKIVSEMKTEFGAGRFDYDLDTKEDASYLKFEIIDNVQVLQESGTAWKTVGFKPVTFSSGYLKRKPASLK